MSIHYINSQKTLLLEKLQEICININLPLEYQRELNYQGWPIKNLE